MSKNRLPLSGGCQCGAVRYRITGRPLTLYCCHCTECQRQASSAFGMSMQVVRNDLEIDWQTMARRARDVGQPNEVHGHFCPDCGVRILHDRPGSSAVTIKAGTLDDTSWLNPIAHIWTASAQPWVQFPDGSLVYEYQPESFDELEAAWAGRGQG